MSTTILGRTLAVAALIGAGAAQAAGNLLLLESPPKASTYAAGGSVWSLPQFPGARKRDTMVLPALDYAGANGVFVSTDLGLGWNLAPTKDVQAGVRLWPQFGRSRKDAPAGLDPIGDRLQAQAFANWQLGEIALLQSGLLYGAGRDRNASQLELGVTSGIPLGDDLIGIGLSASWGDRRFRQDYFGISAAESRASGLPAVQFNGGRIDSALTLSFEHKFDAHWRVSGQVVASRLAGDLARSAVVQSRRQTLGTVSVWYYF